MREAGTPVVHVCVGPDGEASEAAGMVNLVGK
jgi:hypothetical protein